MLFKLKKYDKKYDYSYTYGIYPTLDLFKYRAAQVSRVVLNPDGDKNKGFEEIIQLCKRHRVPFEFNTPLIEKIAAKENTYVVGVFNKYKSSIQAERNHVVLVNPSDPGNLGTIIRSMAGFAFKDLSIVSPAVDVFDPKTVRSSMGALFGVNFEYFDSFQSYKQRFNNHLYPFLISGSTDLRETRFEPPYSLIFGNEGSGLPDSFAQMGKSVKITHTSNIDSLNLSLAAGIALYEAYSQSGR
jgi:TrmH family RNA methyltransferase